MSRRALALLLVALAASPNASRPVAAQEPVGSLDLRSSQDPVLQGQLERIVASEGLSKAVNAGRLALALVDLSAPGRPRLAMLNGDTMIYAASLPKIAILLGAFVEAERGRLPLDPRHLDSITQMVRFSNNEDATRVLGWVGEGRLIDILLSPRYAFYDPNGKGGLWVGKSYGKDPAFRRDPVAQLSHAATAFQVARFYYLLDAGALVGPALTAQMKEVLSHPGIQHKFVKGLLARPGASSIPIARSWSRAGTSS
jgi:beta-lactamase class A